MVHAQILDKEFLHTQNTRMAIERYREAADILSDALFRRIRKGDKLTEERLTAVSARQYHQGVVGKGGVQTGKRSFDARRVSSVACGSWRVRRGFADGRSVA